MPFSLDSWSNETSDGHNLIITCQPEFLSKGGKRYRLFNRSSTDGLSDPKCFWSVYPPFGKQWKAAVFHDAAYRGTLEVWNGTGWSVAGLTRAEADELLREMLLDSGVTLAIVEAIFVALRAWGEKAWEDDLALPTVV